MAMTNQELIGFILAKEDEIRQAIIEKRADDDAEEETSGGGGNRISDPTAQRAIRNVSSVNWVKVEYGAAFGGRRDAYKLRRPEEWLAVIEEVHRHYAGTKTAEIMDLKYRKGMQREEICKVAGISVIAYAQRLAGMLGYALGLATAKGLIKN